MTNKFLQTYLAKKANSKKQNGFTLIELMVVIAIVGILSAVGLPEMLKAQERAHSSVAKQQAVQHAKSCSIELLADGDPTDADLSVLAPAAGVNVSNAATTCGASASYEFTGGGDKWTVTLSNGLPQPPSKS